MQHKITTSQRKFLLLCPFPVLLLVTLSFWILGGGQSSSTAQLDILGNFNLQMPLVNSNHPTPKNKLSYYKKADTKKGSWSTIALRDPALNMPVEKSSISLDHTPEHFVPQAPMAMNTNGMVEKEQQLHYKLQQLHHLVEQSSPDKDTFLEDQKFASQSESVPQLDLEQLEEIMFQISNPQTKDPELTQLNELLETVLDIQHPKRVTKRLEETKNNVAGKYVTPHAYHASVPISCLKIKSGNPVVYEVDFYDLDTVSQEKKAAPNTIPAVIHKAQDVTEGSKVFLRLDQEITLDGTVIRKGHIIYAKASLNKERLLLKVDGIQYGFTQFPVSLVAYGTDGLKGIYMPGVIGRETSKRSGSSFLQRLGITLYNNSIESQIANVGIQTTKNIFSKKVSQQRVQVKSGDQVLLKFEL